MPSKEVKQVLGKRNRTQRRQIIEDDESSDYIVEDDEEEEEYQEVTTLKKLKSGTVFKKEFDIPMQPSKGKSKNAKRPKQAKQPGPKKETSKMTIAEVIADTKSGIPAKSEVESKAKREFLKQ